MALQLKLSEPPARVIPLNTGASREGALVAEENICRICAALRTLVKRAISSAIPLNSWKGVSADPDVIATTGDRRRGAVGGRDKPTVNIEKFRVSRIIYPGPV